jgi:regulatory protein
LENKSYKIKLSPEMAHHKIKNWCAYQERSQFETRQKLFEYGLFSEDVEQIISSLIEENFLNEERFALAYVSGKFNIKHWGRIKIKIELKKHKVSDYLINKALSKIDDEVYLDILKTEIEKKIKITSEKNKQKLIYNLIQYALRKGYENELVVEQVKKIVSPK